MTDHQEIARLITAARRRRGLTQSELARQADCKQSAVSMFERGHANALARPKIDTLLKLLEIERPAGDTQPETTTAEQSVNTAPLRYCPVFDCPSNIPFTVAGTLLIKPQLQPTSDARHCAFCGELLESACPECGAAVNRGACCTQCGTPYISTPNQLDGSNPAAWADTQRTRLRDLGLLGHPER